MPHLLLQELPRYECLLAASESYPTLNPSSTDAFLNLLRTSDLAFEAESAHLHQYGVSQGRFTVLMLLSRMCEQCLSPAGLADKSGVARATMTGLLDTMEKDGLVVRTNSATDRRVIEVTLTEAGHSLVESILPGYFAKVEEIISPLEDGERKEFARLLQKLQAGFSATSLVATPADTFSTQTAIL